MQTAEAETATPDQLRRGATLIVTFPLWPLHFPSIPAFNPSGGGGGVGRARRKQSATAAPQGGKKKERKKEKKIPNPKHTPPLRSPLSQTLAPPLPTTNPPRDSPDAPARRGLGPCGSPAVVGWESARRRPAKRRGGGSMEPRVGNKYRLGRKLGSGSFGEIYLGSCRRSPPCGGISVFLVFFLVDCVLFWCRWICWVWICACRY